MRSEGYSTWSVCLSVCPSVRASSRTTGYEAANEGHQRLLSNENIVAIFLNSYVPEIWRENKRKSQRAIDRAHAIAGRLR